MTNEQGVLGVALPAALQGKSSSSFVIRISEFVIFSSLVEEEENAGGPDIGRELPRG